jgi:membrane-associated phospholipid phosphatase
MNESTIQKSNLQKSNRLNFAIAGGLLVLFVLYTASLLFVDVAPIGPRGSSVAYASMNQAVRHFVGVNMNLYQITDWASLAAILVALGFSFFGLLQWIRRKHILRVDISILVLGGFYLIVFAAYAFFEVFVLNYRPVLIDEILEASYPSSTTMLVMTIMPTAMIQFHRLIGNQQVRVAVNIICALFTVLMVIGRMASGVHWITDIFGGLLLSSMLVMLYYAVVRHFESKKEAEPIVCSTSQNIEL